MKTFSFILISLVFFIQKPYCLSLVSSNSKSVNWSCLIDLSCINVIVNKIKSEGFVNVGYITIENWPNRTREEKQESNENFLFRKGKSLRMNFGPVLIDVSAFKGDDKYIELSVSTNEIGD